MEKYKICPSCGAKNLPTRIECDQCEADLTGVPVTADMPEEKKRLHPDSYESVTVEPKTFRKPDAVLYAGKIFQIFPLLR